MDILIGIVAVIVMEILALDIAMLSNLTLILHPLNFLVLSTLFFRIIQKLVLYYTRLPPGPWGLPLLGYLPFMQRKPPHTLYLEMADRYGDVFSLQLGESLIVCIGSTKVMKEFFSRPDSIGRPQTPLNKLMAGLGIVLNEGLLWKRQRQFLHESFRALGVKLLPNLQFEKYIIMELEELFCELRNVGQTVVDPKQLLGRHLHNVICHLMMSFRFTGKDDQFLLFNERVSRGMKLYGAVNIGEYIKCYLKLPGKQAVVKEIQRNLADISKFHADHIVQRMNHRTATGRVEEPVDLLDHYLNKIDEERNSDPKTKIFPDVDPEKQVVQVMNDLFSTGMETSLTAILWTIVMMLREPKAAAKVRESLKSVVAPHILVTLNDRTSLPYLEAVILETIRMVSVVPLGTTHVNTEEWKINGYTIPAGTHIIPLINRMNHDPTIYPEPNKFKPERFIKDGKIHTHDNFMQFGTGQRMCLGVTLARMELFLFFANLMNHYEFRLPEGDKLPGLDGNLGITHAPAPFNLVFNKLDA